MYLRLPQLIPPVALMLTLLPICGSAPSAAEPAGPALHPTTAEALAAVAEPAAERYLFYLHGAILEGGDRRPSHPERGVYEYDSILEALGGSGLVVISEHRAERTDPDAYAERVAGEVRKLIEAGVAPARITVAGFSKGGVIALRTSHRLGRDDVAFVILAACGPWLEESPLALRGRMLSIYEASDGIGRSCAGAVERSPTRPAAFEEIETHMGGGHGAFWSPRPEWVEPVLAWAAAGGAV